MSGSERKPGRLGRYVDGDRDRLLELGYTPLSVSTYSLVALGQLGRWIASEDLDVQQLDRGAIKAFLASATPRTTGPRRPAVLCRCWTTCEARVSPRRSLPER